MAGFLISKRRCFYSSQQELVGNINAALPFMEPDLRELAARTLSKIDALSESEYAERAVYAADEVWPG